MARDRGAARGEGSRGGGRFGRALRIAVLAAALAPVAAAAAEAGAREKLDFFRGSWTIAGLETTYRETCDWLPGGGFLACESEDRSAPAPDFGLSIFGWSEADGAHTYEGFGADGSRRTLRGRIDESGVWRFWGEAGRGPEWRRWQVAITPTADGFDFREEISEAGGAWRERAAFRYRRLPAAEP